MVECWKTVFSLSDTVAAVSVDGGRPKGYERVPVPVSRESGRHFVHHHCCVIPGLVERYDLYTPVVMSMDDEGGGGGGGDSAAAADDDDDVNTNHPEIIVAVIRLGRNLSGHPDTLHGGVTALLFDDVAGFAADQVLQRSPYGTIDGTTTTTTTTTRSAYCHHPRDDANEMVNAVAATTTTSTAVVVVTANLRIDYRVPVPTETTVLLQVRLSSRFGRKIHLAAQMTDPEQTTVYARANVLYVIPRASL